MTPRLFALSALALSALACGDKTPPSPPPPPAAAPEPQLDRLTMLQQAQAKIKAERERKREELRSVGSATVKEKKLSGKGKSAKIELAFEFTNKSDKTLTLAEGSIAIRDASGKLLKQLKVPFIDPIAPGKKAEKRGKFPLDAGKPEDHALAEASLKELQVDWLPGLYRFEGGTQLQAE